MDGLNPGIKFFQNIPLKESYNITHPVSSFTLARLIHTVIARKDCRNYILTHQYLTNYPFRCTIAVPSAGDNRMSSLFGRIKTLSDKEMRQVHGAALQILEKVGMKIYLREARDILRESGCLAEENSRLVKFPSTLVEESVNRLRRDFLRPERTGLKQAVRYSEVSYYKRDEELHHNFTASAGGFCTLIYDLRGRRRPATLPDVYDSFKLINALDDITYSGLPCSDQQTPYPLRPVKMAAELVKYTTKLGGVEAWTVEDVYYLEEIAVVVRGSRENLLARPCLVGYGESRSPLSLDENMAAVFIEYIKRGLPQSVDTMPSAGTTAPATGAGTLAVGLAETLAGLVLGYAVDKNAILSLDFTGGYCDMKNLLFGYAGPDRLALLGGRIQLLRDLYGITSGVHGGKTDACEPGFQAGMEKASTILFPLLCGASGIGTIGQLEYGMTYSPVQLVLDAECVRATRRMLAGFEVNDQTLGLEAIRRVGPEGNFIADPHTATHFRDEFWLSELTECLNWESYSNKQVRGMENLTAEKAREIMDKPLEPVLDDQQIAEIDRIVAHAEKALNQTA
jgi:trimethylamine---corrinoid protein Co-methyltransferase